MLHNIILITLKTRELSIEELADVIGIGREELGPFVEKLVYEKKIKRDEDVLSLA